MWSNPPIHHRLHIIEKQGEWTKCLHNVWLWFQAPNIESSKDHYLHRRKPGKHHSTCSHPCSPAPVKSPPPAAGSLRPPPRPLPEPETVPHQINQPKFQSTHTESQGSLGGRRNSRGPYLLLGRQDVASCVQSLWRNKGQGKPKANTSGNGFHHSTHAPTNETRMNHITDRARASNIEKKIHFFHQTLVHRSRIQSPRQGTQRNTRTPDQTHQQPRLTRKQTTHRAQKIRTFHEQNPSKTLRKGGAKARYREIRASIKNSEPRKTRERRRKSGITVGFKDTVGGGGGGGGHVGRSC